MCATCFSFWYYLLLLCTAPCISVNTLNSISCTIGSQWSSRSAAVMLRWSSRSKQRTTRAAARCTISSRCIRLPVIPNNAAFPKSSVEFKSACTSVLHAKSGRDCLIRAMFRNRPYAVRHMRVTCVLIDIVESRYTPRSRMLADVLTSLPHMSIWSGDGCSVRFGAANSMTSVFASFNSRYRDANHAFTSITHRRIRSIANAESLRGKSKYSWVSSS